MRPVYILALMLFLATASCGHNYSKGKRTGVVTKFSNKGLIFKSWEGELQMPLGSGQGDQSAVLSNQWDFSTTDPQIATQIDAAVSTGKRVTLSYSQWLVGPLTMGTEYDVTSVEMSP